MSGLREQSSVEIPGEGEKGSVGQKAVNLDTILVEEIGQFGRFQLRMVLLGVLITIFASWGAVEYVFTTARINTRCLIPECDSAEPEFWPSWLAVAVPPDEDGNLQSCRRFANTSSANSASGTCPAELFDRSIEIDCEQRVYENTETIVYDMDLGCEEWMRSLVGSLRTAGTLAALPLTGYISDRWGRRTTLAINAINGAWIGSLRYFANTYVGFVISQFSEAALSAGAYSCAYILVMELVGPKYRVIAGATLSSTYSVSQILLGLIAWAVPYWRKLTLALYLPQLITISYFWVMTESVRWYMSKGRYEESEKVLKNIARVNGRQISDKSLAALRETAEAERKKAQIEGVNEPSLVVQVFRNKTILLRCCVSPIWWITNTFVYYGMSINAVNLSGHRYINYIAVAAAQLPGYWAAMFLLDRVGRRPVLIGSFWICAACQAAYIFMPNDLEWLSLTVYLVGSLSSASVMTSVYVYTTELYPTKYRHSLFAFSSMIGRIGSITAPLTPALGLMVWDKLPFVLFGSLALLSGALIFLTPETLGAKMPDTMEEATMIGKSENK